MQRLRSGTIVTALVSALLALGIGPAAQAWGPAFPGHGGDRLIKAVDSLGLDAEKRASVQAVIDAAKASQRDLHQKMRSAHETMRSLLDQPTPDADAIYAQADTLGALGLEAQKARLHTLLQVRALLTPDEQQRLQAALETSRGGHPGCDGGAPPPPPTDGTL